MKETPAQKRQRIDWEAIHRDYRATKLTLRELGSKHNLTHSAIAQHAKANQWIRGDLAKVVQEATRAALVASALTDGVNNATQGLTTAVSAQVKVNTNIVLAHRTRLTKLLKDADEASAKLMQLANSVADVREASTLVGAIESLARTTKTLIDKEREAYGLNDQTKPDELQDLDDAELERRIRDANERINAG